MAPRVKMQNRENEAAQGAYTTSCQRLFQPCRQSIPGGIINILQIWSLLFWNSPRLQPANPPLSPCTLFVHKVFWSYAYYYNLCNDLSVSFQLHYFTVVGKEGSRPKSTAWLPLKSFIIIAFSLWGISLFTALYEPSLVVETILFHVLHL